jgi:DNA repair protein RadD
MRELLDAGYLAPLVCAQTAACIDTSSVRMQGGDYVVSALAKASDKVDLVRVACAEIVRLAAERQRWLVFAVTVEHAQHIADELRGTHGVACAVVIAKTPKAERAALIRAFRAGQLRALVNVAVLTTGFDVPEIDCIALLRATRSPVLYVQIAGRGMRTAPGKRDCLWLDFTDTTATLGPVDAIKGRNRPDAKTGGAAPFRYCDECGNPNPTAAQACAHCGHAFPVPERVNHTHVADTASAVLSTEIVWHSITRIDYDRHLGKHGKPDTLRVDYWSGWKRVASEFICLEHTGYARMKAARWWMERSEQAPPDSIAEALERIKAGELREPSPIAVQMDGGYPRVVSCRFDVQREAAWAA